jgi:dTDP-4-amino-4,6-dideoxygalactose transaminase
MYYLLLPSLDARTAFIARLNERRIQPVFHYVPLHASPFGATAGRAVGDLPVTTSVSDRLVRLPFWLGLEDQLERVIEEVAAALA